LSLRHPGSLSFPTRRSSDLLWEGVEEQCRRFGLPSVRLPRPDHFLQDDQDLGCCGGVALHTPGHTPGSISFWFDDCKTLVAGDRSEEHTSALQSRENLVCRL